LNRRTSWSKRAAHLGLLSCDGLLQCLHQLVVRRERAPELVGHLAPDAELGFVVQLLAPALEHRQPLARVIDPRLKPRELAVTGPFDVFAAAIALEQCEVASRLFALPFGFFALAPVLGIAPRCCSGVRAGCNSSIREPSGRSTRVGPSLHSGGHWAPYTVRPDSVVQR
jgi:hypothetical protein